MGIDWTVIFTAIITAGITGVITALVTLRKSSSEIRVNVAEASKTEAATADLLVGTTSEVVEFLRQQMRQLQINTAYDRERIDNQVAELAELRERLSVVTVQLDKAVEELSWTKKQISELQAEICRLEEDNKRLRFRLDRATEELSLAKKHIIELQAEVSRLLEENRLLRARLAKYEQSNGGQDGP